MTMHLEGPWLTTNGRWKTKRRKHFSAESAARERELAAEWQQRQADWAKLTPRFAGQGSGTAGQPLARTSLSPQYPPGREPQSIPSREDSPGAVAARPADKVYTGTKIKGIGTLHKSNAVPIFTDDEAVAIAHMRRQVWYHHPGTHLSLYDGRSAALAGWSMKEFPYPVTLDWARRPSDEKWNEICAWTVEHFGLPGIRYQTEVDVARMTWYFQSHQDQLIMTVAWGNDNVL